MTQNGDWIEMLMHLREMQHFVQVTFNLIYFVILKVEELDAGSGFKVLKHKVNFNAV